MSNTPGWIPYKTPKIKSSPHQNKNNKTKESIVINKANSTQDMKLFIEFTEKVLLEGIQHILIKYINPETSRTYSNKKYLNEQTIRSSLTSEIKMNSLVIDLKKYYQKSGCDLSEINYFFPGTSTQRICSNFLSWLAFRSIFVNEQNILIDKNDYEKYNINSSFILNAVDTKMFIFIELKKYERTKGKEDLFKQIIIPDTTNYPNYGYISKYNWANIANLFYSNGVLI